jgi:hypothetical protein
VALARYVPLAGAGEGFHAGPSVPSGFLEVFEMPNRSSFSCSFTFTVILRHFLVPSMPSLLPLSSLQRVSELCRDSLARAQTRVRSVVGAALATSLADLPHSVGNDYVYVAPWGAARFPAAVRLTHVVSFSVVVGRLASCFSD